MEVLTGSRLFMNKNEIINKLDSLHLDKTQYWLVAGAAMVLYGIRDITCDIDIGCSKMLADELESSGYPTSAMPNGMRRIQISEDVEAFENWYHDKVCIHNGFHIITLIGLLEMKRELGREKDMDDIVLIEEYMGKNMLL